MTVVGWIRAARPGLLVATLVAAVRLRHASTGDAASRLAIVLTLAAAVAHGLRLTGAFLAVVSLR